jgi:hypothetical protein
LLQELCPTGDCELNPDASAAGKKQPLRRKDSKKH